MKFCKLCGETYRDHVDFCFVDGELLAERPTRAGEVDPQHLEAPDPGRLATPDRRRLESLPPTRSATPLPRSRRSLLQRAQAGQGAAVAPAHTAAEERMTPTPVMVPRQDEPRPERLTPAPVPAHAPRQTPAPAPREPRVPAPEPWDDIDLEPEGPPLGTLAGGALLVFGGILVLGAASGLFGGDDPVASESPSRAAPDPAPSAIERVVAPPVEEEAPTAAVVEPEPVARTAPVRFVTTPSGATVRVGGRDLGVTPLKVDLALGDHQVRIELDGYEPLQRTIEVSPGENLAPTWTLLPKAPPAVARVPVRVDVPGRRGDALRIDGEDAGVLPVDLELREGLHVFEVSGPGGAFRVRRDVRASADGARVLLQLGP